MTRRRGRLFAAGTVVVCLAAASVFGARYAATGSPVPFDDVRRGYCPSDARLLDRHGALLHEARIDPAGRRLAWTPLDTVSPALVAAVLRSEDRRFFTHDGVDTRAMAAAVWQRLRGGAARGASTLSMQVAALLDPTLMTGSGPRTLSAKWRQMRAAWALERAWTKHQLLEAYFNLVTFRGELQGVAAAAQVLFGKAPHGLTAAESLVLAALLRAPNADRAALARRVASLGARGIPDPCSRGPCGRWRRGATPPPRSARRAGTSPATTHPSNRNATDLDRAIDRVFATPRGSGSRLALAPHAARRLLPQSGASPCADTPSTLDRDTQRYAAASLRRHLLAIRDRSARDAAVLVADNASGDVLAYVAASGDLSGARHVDGIQARRQAGSTLKPFLYARALDRRLLTAASLLDDTPLELAVGPGLFRPRNYDEQFRGLVPLRTALAGSLNVPAVRTLLLIGPDDFATQLRQLGFAGVAEPGDYYGPSLALGSADVTLWELVSAYRTLANGGVWTPLHLQSTPTPPVAISGDGGGQGGACGESCSPYGESADRSTAASLREASGRDARLHARAIGRAAAFIVSDILADRDSRSVTFGLESALATRFWSAVKTGTSKDMRDNWCIGYSRRYTVGVWVGNFSGEPMRDVSGVTGAAPIWADIMSWLHRDLPSEAPAAPPSVQRAAIGAAATRRSEWFLTGTVPDDEPLRAQLPRIIAPTDGSVIAVDPDIPAARQRVAFEAAAGHGARWVLDGADIGPGSGLVLWSPLPGMHTLELVAADARPLGTIEFEVRGLRRARSGDL